MARKSRRNHTPTFKARVALEAWREKSVAELAKKYEMHTTQINDWKRRRVIERPNQVWALDTTYIPMSSGFVYLTAVIDVATRAVLSHRVATTLESCHAVETLEMAFERHGTPQIVNADQGSRFTAEDFVNAVKTRGCQFSVDGREAWRDNVFVERSWRTIKYGEVYFKAYDSVAVVRRAIDSFIDWYNNDRAHSAVGRAPPMWVYDKPLPTLKLAARLVRDALPTASVVRRKRRPPPSTSQHRKPPQPIHLSSGFGCSNKRGHL